MQARADAKSRRATYVLDLAGYDCQKTRNSRKWSRQAAVDGDHVQELLRQFVVEKSPVTIEAGVFSEELEFLQRDSLTAPTLKR